jgi:hypothetical protein
MPILLRVVREWHADVGSGNVPFTTEHTLAKYSVPVTIVQDVTGIPQEGEEGEDTCMNDDSDVLADAQILLYYQLEMS